MLKFKVMANGQMFLCHSATCPCPVAEWLARRAEEHMPPLCGFETRPG